MSERDDWFVTASGKRVFVLDPEAKDICIEDIAHALSMICRFGGHCHTFYSVAQHSVLVAQNVAPEHAFCALLHDATEAYLGDVIRPLKRQLPRYNEIEAMWWEAIAERFALPVEMPPEVKRADVRALITERRDLVAPEARSWNWKEDERGVEPFERIIRPLPPAQARGLFMGAFDLLSLGGQTMTDKEQLEEELTEPDPIPGFGVAAGEFHVREGAPAEHAWGVQYQGSYESATDGTARAVRLHARALDTAGVPVLLQSYTNSFVNPNGVRVGAEAMDERIKENFRDLRHRLIGSVRLRIKHMVVTSVDQLRSSIIPRSVTHQDVERAVAIRDELYRRTIVYSVWERTTIAPSIASVLRRVAECWVPCEQNRELLQEHGVERVVVVPHPIDPTSQMQKLLRRPAPSPFATRRFYAIGAWQPRKHLHETIGAFLIAFSAGDDVSLVVKTSKHLLPDYPSPAASRSMWLADPRVVANGWNIYNIDRKVTVVTRAVPEDQILKLHYSSNIYVAASRGEAFNLPAFDAKCAGNRMVYVGYGGMRDFAAPDDVTVPYELRPVPRAYGWEEGALWGEATVEDLAEAMRTATVPEAFREPPGMGRFSMAEVGSLMKERVMAVLEKAGEA